MRILFLAKHDSGDNDDEGAVSYALRALGHEVTCIDEHPRRRTIADNETLRSRHFDFCLYFKCPTVSLIRDLQVPAVAWYFDKVGDGGDRTLMARSQSRKAWFRDILPFTTLAFCTDGDWVNEDTTGKLRWLMQGMDERVAGLGQCPPGIKDDSLSILFMGMIHHGQDRSTHVKHLQDRWGTRFHVLGDSGPRYRIHGRQLADYLAGVKIVVAPSGPNTDRYWSNRVYLTTGLGGFLLHPYSKGLTKQYVPHRDLMYYKDWQECDDLIAYYLDNPESRQIMRVQGYNRTMICHTYKDRCKELIRQVEEAI